MASSISETWCSAANVQPVVVVLSDVEMPGVFSSIIIAVPDEGGFVVIVEVGVGDCYPFRCVGDVDESVVVVFIVGEVGVQLAVSVLVRTVHSDERIQTNGQPTISQ